MHIGKVHLKPCTFPVLCIMVLYVPTQNELHKCTYIHGNTHNLQVLVILNQQDMWAINVLL